MIRKAKASDIDALITMYKALINYHRDFGQIHQVTPKHYEIRREFYMAIINKNTPEQNLGFILVEEDGGRLVGMIVAQYLTSLDGHKYTRQAFLQDLFVDPNSRRKHLGTILGHESIIRCQKDGIEMVYIWVAPQNTHVQAVVKEMGFETAFKFDTLVTADYKKPPFLE